MEDHPGELAGHKRQRTVGDILQLMAGLMVFVMVLTVCGILFLAAFSSAFLGRVMSEAKAQLLAGLTGSLITIISGYVLGRARVWRKGNKL